MIASMDEVFAVQHAGDIAEMELGPAELAIEIQTAALRTFLEVSAVYLELSHELGDILVKEMHEIGDTLIGHEK